jgi:hypothetical protein
MGCEIELGLALGSMERRPGVEADTVRTALEEGVDLMDSEVVVGRKGSEAGLGTLGRGYGSAGAVPVGSLGLPTGCRCGWRPWLRCLQFWMMV